MANKNINLGGLNHAVISYKENDDGTKTLVIKPILPDNSSNLMKQIMNFLSTRRSQFPTYSSVMNASYDVAAKEVAKLLNKGEDEETIIKCLNLALTDPFWKKNLMVLTSLNTICSSGITKYEHLKLKLSEKSNNNRFPAKSVDSRDFKDYGDLS